MYLKFQLFRGGKVGRFWKPAPNLFSSKRDQHVTFIFVNNYEIKAN